MSYTPERQVFPGQMEKVLKGTVIPVTMESRMDQGVTSADFENTVGIIMVLSMKHSSCSEKATQFTRMLGFGNNRKRQKAEGPNFNRLFHCADLRKPCSCFAVVLESINQSRSLFGQIDHQHPIVGGIYAMVEPMPTEDRKRMGPLPMIGTQHNLIPLKYATKETAITAAIPEATVTSTLSSGEQSYFVLHNEVVNLNMYELRNDGTCNGIQCDKSIRLESSSHYCGCMFTSVNSGSFVGQCTVRFDNPFPATVHDGSIVEVQNFRSFRTTRMFFKKFSEYSMSYRKEEHFTTVRAEVKKMVDYVNEKCGWTVVGWFRKGEVSDASNEAEKIDNSTVTVHISLLVPTDAEVTSTDEFKALQIETPTGQVQPFLVV